MNSEMGGDNQMAGVKDPFDDSERPFDQRSDSADSVISAFIYSWDGMPSDGSSHGFVHWGKRYWPKIPFIPVDCFSFLREIDLTVMNRCSCCIESSDELVFLIDDRMKFVSDDLFPFLTLDPSWLFRVFAVSPPGLSDGAWPGSDVMIVASVDSAILQSMRKFSGGVQSKAEWKIMTGIGHRWSVITPACIYRLFLPYRSPLWINVLFHEMPVHFFKENVGERSICRVQNKFLRLGIQTKEYVLTWRTV